MDNYLNVAYELKEDQTIHIPFEAPQEGYWCHIYDGKLLQHNLPQSVIIDTTHHPVSNPQNPFDALAQSQDRNHPTLIFQQDLRLKVYLEYCADTFLTSCVNLELQRDIHVWIELHFNGAQNGFVSHSTHSTLKQASHLELTQIESFAQNAVAIVQNSFSLLQGSYCKLFSAYLSGQHLQNFVLATLDRDSHIDVKSLLHASMGQKQIFSCDISHHGNSSESKVASKQVLKDNSVGVFDATTTINKGTKSTKALQSSHALLLNEKAQIHAKPHLEIYSDDLTASHGSTVGELDDQAFNYLILRGITPSKAESMLINAFIKTLLEDLDKEHKQCVISALGVEDEDSSL